MKMFSKISTGSKMAVKMVNVLQEQYLYEDAVFLLRAIFTSMPEREFISIQRRKSVACTLNVN